MWCSTVGCIVILILSLLAAPRTAAAQALKKVPRVGYLSDESVVSLNCCDGQIGNGGHNR